MAVSACGACGMTMVMEEPEDAERLKYKKGIERFLFIVGYIPEEKIGNRK